MAIFRGKKDNTTLTKKCLDQSGKGQWLSQSDEGELAIDSYETEKDFVIQSTIAGIEAKDLDILIEEDMLTIKGKRERPQNIEEKNYFQQECFWGSFSRKIILPEKVKINQAKATVKNGVLTLKIPKASKKATNKISIIDK